MTRARAANPAFSALMAASVLLAACSSSDDDGVRAAGSATTARPDVTTAPTTLSTTLPTTTDHGSTATTPPAASAAGGLTAIEVPSTTSQYFVLYVKPDVGAATEIPVAIAKGQAGTTVLSDGRSRLSEDSYRVATFSVERPGDADGDGIDDLTELADSVNLNPLNPAPTLDARAGAVIVGDVKKFADLSYQGNDVARDSYLAGLEFMKFWIVGTNTAHPAVYFMNTNTYKAHPEFASAVGIVAGRGPVAGSMRGDIVYNPEGIAPDGSKG